AATRQLSALSLQLFAHSPPLEHGLPAWWQVPPPQVSVPLQNRPSSHDAVLFVCAHVPAPLHMSSVHGLLSSVHAVPAGLEQSSVAQEPPAVLIPSSRADADR